MVWLWGIWLTGSAVSRERIGYKGSGARANINPTSVQIYTQFRLVLKRLIFSFTAPMVGGPTVSQAVTHTLFATTAKGLEPLLADELTALGASDVRPTRAGVAFTGDLELAYRACLWSRLASRILLLLDHFTITNADDLYAAIKAVAWEQHLTADGTLAVEFTGGGSGIDHTRFGAQRVKDGVVDRLRERTGRRPSVDPARPDLRIHLHLARGEAQLYIDLAGEPLHRRGYRLEAGAAPLKESLAAALLLRAGWPEIAAAGGGLVDPLCGSGTLPIEAALIAADCAPGIDRDYYGFEGWLGHMPALWQQLHAEARERRSVGLGRLPAIAASDSDGAVVALAEANATRAGLAGKIHFSVAPLTAVQPVGEGAGLVITNPPYGERLEAQEGLGRLYADLGATLRERFEGWRAAIFTGNPPLGLCLGLKARRSHTFWNGPIECRLLTLTLAPEAYVTAQPPPGSARPALRPLSQEALGEGAQMLINRLRKNLKHLGRWARRNAVDCYRLYDADLPEYAFALDLYTTQEGLYAHLQEYAPPAAIDPRKAALRLREAATVVQQLLELAPERLVVKVRQRQKGRAQYEKLGESGQRHQVREDPCRFWVNLTDYLDTGLFLDHRTTRSMVGELAQGRDVLNLFCYTATATVHAALGGAASTTSVDLSNTYIDWARRNLALNGIQEGAFHRLVRADCFAWLEGAPRERRRYGLIFLDPPTFSNSKRMEESFDVERDQERLITLAARLLDEDGILIFSTNHRRFKLRTEAHPGLHFEEITRATLPEDFARNPRIHTCWLITREAH